MQNHPQVVPSSHATLSTIRKSGHLGSSSVALRRRLESVKRTSIESQQQQTRTKGTALKQLVMPSDRSCDTRNTINIDASNHSGLKTQSSVEKLTFKMLRGMQ